MFPQIGQEFSHMSLIGTLVQRVNDNDDGKTVGIPGSFLQWIDYDTFEAGLDILTGFT